ncbi:Tryptophan halogenase [Sphingomonas palmae]|uniref:Tryptophan halogenase n=1 Tax=Sphingomonas palmae TaxID=1855283 RepID=A0A1H7UN98_9SPHN|nr:tryptophan halogenase family protein [Sphingomonas palmae]SEL98118.1 Tryptophan halogenase [Sphingomonas palmae]
MRDAPPLSPRVVVLGGGTAGWMAACLFAARWPRARVTVVEAPEIGIVGVGEGSTPQLRALFARLGIAEDAWMPAADATYKTGIRFDGWSARAGYSSYFHPFASAIDLHTAGAFHACALARRTGRAVDAHPDRFFLNTRLAEAHRAPIAPEHFPFEVGYGYHFDAHKVGAVLRDHALAQGVVHVAARVDTVELGDGGDIAALILAGGERLTGDIFVDASGFRSVIAQGALGVRFVPFARNLFCDRAVTLPTPRKAGAPIDAHTTATALSSGWAWAIPLTSRTGNGYVYASDHLSADAAETELRRHLGLLDADVAARHLTMKVGRVEEAWHANCLAIGLAQGFIEPLEATALHLTQTTVERFIDAYEEGQGTPARRDTFNAEIARRFEGVRDYIVAHYRLNQRHDTDFWHANAANNHLSDDLKAIMTAWFTGRDVAAEVTRRDLAGFYSALSWEVLFAGYSTFPDDARLRPALAPTNTAAIDRLLDGCLLNFGDHAAALARR